MRTEFVVVGVALALVGTAFGASAFTTAQVTHSPNIQVASDQNALVGFAPGGQSGGMVYTSNGQVQIDTSNLNNANGVNSNAKFTLGNAGSVGSSTNLQTKNAAFVVTNNDTRAHTFKFSYSASNGHTNAVSFDIYTNVQSSTSGHNSVQTVSDGTSQTTVSVKPGNKVFVVVNLDTSSVSTSSNLNGNLQVTAQA